MAYGKSIIFLLTWKPCIRSYVVSCLWSHLLSYNQQIEILEHIIRSNKREE